MKNLFTILLTLFAINVFAQNGNMIFFTEDNENFTLMVNGITINTIPSNNVRVDNRPVARYKVVVKFQKSELGSIIDNVYVVAGNDKTFVVKPRPAADIQAERAKNLKNPKTKNNYVAKYAIRLFSANPTTATQVPNPNPGYNTNGGNSNGYNSGGTNTGGVDINANPNGMNMNTGTGNDPMNPNININVNPNGMQVNGGGINMNASATGTGQQSSSYSTTTTTTSTTTTGSGGTWSGCAAPLTAMVFQNEERKVRNQTTEAGKMITAQQLSTNYCLTSAQIKTLCTDIFQERDRLAFAEYAYPRCYDPANFSVVYSAFYIEANVQELNRFVTAYGTGTATTGYNNNNNNGGYNSNNNGGYNNNNNNNGGYNNGGGYVPGYNGPYGCPMPMNGNDFNTAKESIRSKTFESTKLEIAKQITDANCFTAQQIKELVKVFEFEATKLEFAKYAFPHCYDKNNYYKVNDAFDFEASMTDLSNFVKGK